MSRLLGDRIIYTWGTDLGLLLPSPQWVEAGGDKPRPPWPTLGHFCSDCGAGQMAHLPLAHKALSPEPSHWRLCESKWGVQDLGAQPLERRGQAHRASLFWWRATCGQHADTLRLRSPRHGSQPGLKRVPQPLCRADQEAFGALAKGPGGGLSLGFRGVCQRPGAALVSGLQGTQCCRWGRREAETGNRLQM